MTTTRNAKALCGLSLIALLIVTTSAVPALGARVHTRRIKFPRGRTTVVLKNAVVRGDSDRYLLRAMSGQTMTVHLTSVEDNAVFEVYAPRSGRTMSGATTDWTGELPRNGDYIIMVSGTRGNADYTLEVTVR
jgi:hypothetical protein